MTKIDELVKNIDALITTETPEETITALQQVKEGLGEVQKEINAKDDAFMNLKQQYINNLKSYPVGRQEDASKPDASRPLTFEECVANATKK